MFKDPMQSGRILLLKSIQLFVIKVCLKPMKYVFRLINNLLLHFQKTKKVKHAVTCQPSGQ